MLPDNACAITNSFLASHPNEVDNELRHRSGGYPQARETAAEGDWGSGRAEQTTRDQVVTL
jgi:hypothetical protein